MIDDPLAHLGVALELDVTRAVIAKRPAAAPAGELQAVATKSLRP
ncbi:hypothetical protein [Mycobacterium sp. AZCC_0083]|nr:hypothetical protein [Mycobacterium sp. AZCC_0083]MBB5168190.1 hypothetical protein [Mycobacterium sp. AZCC_0083]